MEGSNWDDGSPAVDGAVHEVNPSVLADGQVVVLDQRLEAASKEGHDEDHHRMGFSKMSCDSAVAVHELHTAGNLEWENDDHSMGTYVVEAQKSQNFELHCDGATGPPMA